MCSCPTRESAILDQFKTRNRLLQAMSSDDFARLQPHLETVDLSLQQILIAPNQPVSHLYFLESGISSITTEGAGGKVEVGMCGREGLVGAVPILLGSDRFPYDHFMQLGGDAQRIDPRAMLAACDTSPSMRRLLLRYIQTELVQARHTAFVNATFSIEARLARWLLMCHDRSDSDELQLKHEFLSMMLGVQRSGVTLALQNLEGGGRIRGRRGRITIVSREALEIVANGSYGAAEAEYARLIEGA